jgi:hypothetical protein
MSLGTMAMEAGKAMLSKKAGSAVGALQGDQHLASNSANAGAALGDLLSAGQSSPMKAPPALPQLPNPKMQPINPLGYLQGGQ